ncbi:MAG: polysaccharide lyase [Pseudomonadota bacterium]|nr:polysaccharide lyase [Pseudomonadota bacterium]
MRPWLQRRTLAAALVASLAGPVALPAATRDFETLLQEDFETGDFTAEGGLYYKKNFEQSAGTVEFQSDVVRSGKGALRLSVRPICPPGQDDCSERAEVWERTKLWAPYDRGMWYRFSVKLAEPVPDDDHRYLIAQWKRQILPNAKGDFSPFLALRMNRGKLFATVETNLLAASRQEAKGTAAECTSGQAQVWLRPDTNQTRALIATDGSFVRADGRLFNACSAGLTVIERGHKLPGAGSGWIDFVIYTKPGPDGTGHIEIFAGGRWIVTVKGHIGHGDPGLGSHQYFKFGPYRAAGARTWTLYYDDFRRSPRCADVMEKVLCPF